MLRHLALLLSRNNLHFPLQAIAEGGVSGSASSIAEESIEVIEPSGGEISFCRNDL